VHERERVHLKQLYEINSYWSTPHPHNIDITFINKSFFFFLREHKRKYFGKNSKCNESPQWSTGKIFSEIFSWKFIPVWNDMRASNWWQNFHFWVNYPFKMFCFLLNTITKILAVTPTVFSITARSVYDFELLKKSAWKGNISVSYAFTHLPYATKSSFKRSHSW